MRILRVILLAALLLGPMAAIEAAGPAWETVQAASVGAPVSDSDKVDVLVRDGYIYVTTHKAVNVKVMSIVGQLISEQKLPAGTSRLKISARGIYILKAGSATVRITI